MLRLAAPLVAAVCLLGCPTPEIEPTLTAIHEEILFLSCGAYDSCHGGPEPQNGLDLSTAELSYDSLVGVDAVALDGVRVVPGDPDSSLMYQLLWGPGGDVPQMPVGYKLPEAELRAIRDWIADGAQDN